MCCVLDMIVGTVAVVNKNRQLNRTDKHQTSDCTDSPMIRTGQRYLNNK